MAAGRERLRQRGSNLRQAAGRGERVRLGRHHHYRKSVAGSLDAPLGQSSPGRRQPLARRLGRLRLRCYGRPLPVSRPVARVPARWRPALPHETSPEKRQGSARRMPWALARASGAPGIAGPSGSVVRERSPQQEGFPRASAGGPACAGTRFSENSGEALRWSGVSLPGATGGVLRDASGGRLLPAAAGCERIRARSAGLARAPLRLGLPAHRRLGRDAGRGGLRFAVTGCRVGDWLG